MDETDEYIEFLENMLIILSKCYKDTQDVLLTKLLNKETDVYLEVPAIEGSGISMFVDKISKQTSCKGLIKEDKLEGYASSLIEAYQKEKNNGI